eukprot:COSAG06_NODE_22540_length_720_cov_1.011272_1_plen_59_part_10
MILFAGLANAETLTEQVDATDSRDQRTTEQHRTAPNSAEQHRTAGLAQPSDGVCRRLLS